MDFNPSPEQILLRDSASRFRLAEYDFNRRQRRIESGQADDNRHWPRFAELGWLMVVVPEALGGLGGDPADMMILAEELGAALALEPFLGCAVLAPHALISAGDPKEIAPLIESIMAGERIVALAATEAGSRGDPAWMSMQARRVEGGYRLSGKKIMVLGGPIADTLLVAARTSGDESSEDGISLFIVDPVSPGITRTDYATIDHMARSDIALDDVLVGDAQLIGIEGSAFPAIETATHLAILTAAAETIGAMDKALWLTRDYLKVRKQFGVFLSDFQALQHRMADMYVALEQARSILFQGLQGIGHSDRTARARAISAVKIIVAQSARFVTGQAIQLHGGVGTTEEFPVGHCFQRATVLNSLFGSEDYHVQRLGALLQPDLSVAL